MCWIVPRNMNNYYQERHWNVIEHFSIVKNNYLFVYYILILKLEFITKQSLLLVF